MLWKVLHLQKIFRPTLLVLPLLDLVIDEDHDDVNIFEEERFEVAVSKEPVKRKEGPSFILPTSGGSFSGIRSVEY